MTELILNELLCFVQNNFGAVPLGNLACAINGFYDEAEVLSAKDILFVIFGSRPSAKPIFHATKPVKVMVRRNLTRMTSWRCMSFWTRTLSVCRRLLLQDFFVTVYVAIIPRHCCNQPQCRGRLQQFTGVYNLSAVL